MSPRSALFLAVLVSFLAFATAGADPIETQSTYLTFRPDLRLCPSPLCGGYWVKWVNRASTRCHDGVMRSECHVARIDFVPTKLTDAQVAEYRRLPARGLLRGEIVVATYATGPAGVLRATEAWQAASVNPPKGTFFRVTDKGIRCITTPCFSLHEATLNSTLSTDLSGLNLTPAGAPADKVSKAYESLRTTSLLAAGSNVATSSAQPSPAGRTLVASQFYLKLLPIVILK